MTRLHLFPVQELLRVIALAAPLAAAGPVHAQSQTAGPGAPNAQAGPAAGILVLNQEQLIDETEYGRRLQRDLEAVSSALAAQNRGIEADLTQEELDLADLRGTIAADEFRALADAFDARVEAIRATQEAKARDLTAEADRARAQFFERAAPILLDIVRARGAAVLMDSRAVLLSAESVDITAAAVDAMDTRLGDGGPEPLIEIDLGATAPGLD